MASDAALTSVVGEPTTTTKQQYGTAPYQEQEEPEQHEYRGSCSRWWVLFTFSLAAMAQAVTWNIFSPVSTTLKDAYGATWGDHFISWCTNTANIVRTVCVRVFVLLGLTAIGSVVLPRQRDDA